jgi:RNA-directed DNA polymerase
MYGASEEVATIIAQTCCFKNALPQGAPTSPVISNMICGKLDAELKSLAREFKCTYTRYCDDLTFSNDHSTFPSALASVCGSGAERTIELGQRVTSIVQNNGFQINEQKNPASHPVR